ncbi:MAG: hypothetical protein LBG60_09500, partial [Bifidobacteriaceae bacterium]|nr:hypothetical protein [Bifidobacteriaceae bacterium]
MLFLLFGSGWAYWTVAALNWGGAIALIVLAFALSSRSSTRLLAIPLGIMATGQIAWTVLGVISYMRQLRLWGVDWPVELLVSLGTAMLAALVLATAAVLVALTGPPGPRNPADRPVAGLATGAVAVTWVYLSLPLLASIVSITIARIGSGWGGLSGLSSPVLANAVAGLVSLAAGAAGGVACVLVAMAVRARAPPPPPPPPPPPKTPPPPPKPPQQKP